MYLPTYGGAPQHLPHVIIFVMSWLLRHCQVDICIVANQETQAQQETAQRAEGSPLCICYMSLPGSPIKMHCIV